VLKFINYVVDAVFSVFDGALDFVVNIITAAIFDAIPGLKDLFRALDFGQLETFITGPFQSFRVQFLEIISLIKDELSLERLNPGRELNAYWQTNVLNTPHTRKTDAISSSSRDILVTFACAVGYYPVVGT